MPQSNFKIGDNVRLKNKPDRVGVIIAGPETRGGYIYWKVFFGPREERYIREDFLEPHQGSLNVKSILLNNSWGDKETLTRCITFTKLKKPLRNIVYSFSASRTLFFPYQFKPILKFLDSAKHRLLIADEVGLGKTIEAGLILLELQARFPLNRILIVCPAHLRQKWYEEMNRRFSEEFTILDATGIINFLAKVEERGDRACLRGICSLQTLRSRNLSERLEEQSPPLDLVIIDEAAHLRNRDTLSNRLGRILGECADAMLLLTATPIQMKSLDLFSLLEILDPEGFRHAELFSRLQEPNEIILDAERILRKTEPPDFKSCKEHLIKIEDTAFKDRFLKNPIYKATLRKLDEYDATQRKQVIELQSDILSLSPLSSIFTRTRKREVHENCPKREAKVIRKEFSLQEKKFYDVITGYCTKECDIEKKWSIAPFVLINLQRQMASCIPAMIEYQLKRLGGAMDREICGLENEESDLIQEDWEQEEKDAFLADEEKKSLLSILRYYKQEIGEKDSKFEALLEYLQELEKSEPKRKIIIFSYFKETLKYLLSRLEDAGYRCVLITGDVKSYPNDWMRDERGKRLKCFREDPNIKILLSSEVGSEGLDFQFCNILINYDLPWNPMVLEQRIGRLDRIGQKEEKVIILNFSIKGTIEDRILVRLYDRIKIFEASIGDLETILGDCIKELTKELVCSRLPPEEQEKKIDHVAQVIERKRHENEILEKECSRFIGHDEFFLEEIKRVKSLNKYVTPEELEVFVRDFLEKEHPECSLKQSNQDGIYTLKLSKELESHIREAVPGDFLNLKYKIDQGHGILTITFRNDVAFDNQDIEYVSSKHSLIRAILKYYEEKPERIHPVARVSVQTNLIPLGTYLYVLYNLIINSAREERILEPIFVPISNGNIPDAETSEQLLVEIINKGKTARGTNLSKECIEHLWDSANKIFEERLNATVDNIRKYNDATVNNRLASLEESYKIIRSKKEQLLEDARQKKREERYIRMLEGTIRRIEEDYLQNRNKLEQAREVTYENEDCAAGIVEVLQSVREMR